MRNKIFGFMIQRYLQGSGTLVVMLFITEYLCKLRMVGHSLRVNVLTPSSISTHTSRVHLFINLKLIISPKLLKDEHFDQSIRPCGNLQRKCDFRVYQSQM